MATVTRLDDFGFLTIRGRDAISFFQGYTTCDVDSLGATRAGLGALCNLQGRMVTSFRIAAMGEDLLLRMDRSLIEPSQEFLKKYIVFSKAETADESDKWTCFGVTGDDWGSDLPRGVHDCLATDFGYIVRVSDHGPRFEVFSTAPPPELEAMSQSTLDAWRGREIEDGLAWVRTETADAFIPQMFNYDMHGGISFTKGCYLGQEIVARMQHRGAVNRRLHRGRTPTAVSTGDVLYDKDGKTPGTVVAAAESSFLAVVQAKDEVTPECFIEGGQPVELEIIPRHQTG